MHDSPCSVPSWLRFAIPFETEAEQECCRAHDECYAKGGTHVDRLRADLHFAMDLLDAGMAPDSVDRYVWAVRMYGGFAWNGGDRPGAGPIHPPEDVQAGG